MKKTILLHLLLLFCCFVNAQTDQYDLKENIPYYDNTSGAVDKYMSEKCVLDIYYPKDVKNFSTVIWFHGGGITQGSKQIPYALKKKGICVIGVGYRLSPNVKCPAYIEDAAAATAWVFKNIKNYGGDPKKIFVSGISAGGYLALMVGMDKKWLKPYGIDANNLAGLIPFSGQVITHFTVRQEKGIKPLQPTIDEYAPLYHVRSDASPLLLITGDRELELFGRYEENAYMMRMMKLAKHKQTTLYELEGYGHNMAEPAYPLLLKWIEKIVNPSKEKQQD